MKNKEIIKCWIWQYTCGFLFIFKTVFQCKCILMFCKCPILVIAFKFNKVNEGNVKLGIWVLAATFIPFIFRDFYTNALTTFVLISIIYIIGAIAFESFLKILLCISSIKRYRIIALLLLFVVDVLILKCGSVC